MSTPNIGFIDKGRWYSWSDEIFWLYKFVSAGLLCVHENVGPLPELPEEKNAWEDPQANIKIEIIRIRYMSSYSVPKTSI